MKRKVLIAGTLVSLGMMLGTTANAQKTEAAKYTISKTTKPCNSTYRRLSSYNSKTKHYYTIKSYLERLQSKGGGTLVLKKGTYKVCSSLVIPSNVTIQLKNGTKIKKTYVTGTSALKPSKVLFKLSNAKAKNYKGAKKIAITSTKKATIDLGKVENAIGIDLGHNYSVNVSNIQFRGKNGGTYINIAGSKKVRVQNCAFANGEDSEGDKYKTAVTINSVGRVPCENVQIVSNTFSGIENGIASTKYKKSIYSTKIVIQKNTFKDMSSSAVLGKMWSAPVLSDNTVSSKGAEISAATAFRLYSMTEPTIVRNTISGCRYPISFSRSSSIDNVVSGAKIEEMKGNNVSNMEHYYVLYKNATTSRLLYFQSKDDNNFTVTPTSGPYREHYDDQPSYTANDGQAKIYYMLRSYMEQLEYAGGGTITLAAGTYTLSHSVCIPSNVTINLSDGVIIQKVKAINTNLATNKTMFEIVPPSKENLKASVDGYNGSQNVTIQGMGSSVLDCNNVLNAMAIVMGHANNVTIRNIAFTNEYGSHFVELNSSKNVTIDNCSFTDFRIYTNKSHKEAINIDTTDANNNGFNYEWSNHDRTACNTVMVNNCIFTNMGVAVGSHTYSVTTDNQQIYHENVTIQNCKVNQTYNAAVRVLNWRNPVIKDNMFLGIQGLEDNKGYKYVCILAKGVVNPTITGNTFNRGKRVERDIRACAVRIDMVTAAAVEGAIKAGYANTVSVLSEQNLTDLKNNTILDDSCFKYFRIVNEDGTYQPREQCLFNNATSGAEGEDTSKEEVVAED